MHVLCVGRSFPEKRTGRMGLFEWQQAVALVELGYDVGYAYVDYRSVKSNHRLFHRSFECNGVVVEGCNVPVRPLPNTIVDGFRDGCFGKVLERYVSTYEVPDVVYVHFPTLTLSHGILDCLTGLGVPLVMIEHYSAVQNMTLPDRQVSLLRRCVETADSFLCVSEDLRDSIARYCSLEDSSSIAVIPNMVRDEFHYCDEEAVRNRFVFAGRLVRAKRVDLLLHAFCEEFAAGEAELAIIGDGLRKAQYQALTRHLHSTGKVAFLGWADATRIAEVMRKSLCYVSASDFETFGVPFAEAWCCGTPCIAAHNTPLRLHFDKGRGELFEKGSKMSLRSSMRSVLENASAFDRRGISEWATERFSKAAVMGRVASILASSCCA